MGLLSLTIWLPVAVGTLLLALGRDEHAGAVRWTALIGAIAGLLVTLPLITQFDLVAVGLQFQEIAAWISRFNVKYHLGV